MVSYCNRFLLLNFIVWVLSRCESVVSPCSSSASVVTYSQLKTMLSNRSVQLFDVRNPDEFQAGRIPHAVNIPCKCLQQSENAVAFPVSSLSYCVWTLVDTLEESLKLSPERFQQKFDVKAPKKDDNNIVFHCRSGNRSLKALDIARQLGFRR